MANMEDDYSDFLPDSTFPYDLDLTPPVGLYNFLSDYFDSALMASNEVDQRFLGHYAQRTEQFNFGIASVLYRILGLSVLLSKKLIRARRQRKLDNTRDTKSVLLYHHIIWLSKQGLSLLKDIIFKILDEQPYTRYHELRVLTYKLIGSFYHIFVLFHNQPSMYQTAASLTNKMKTDRGSIRKSPDPLQGGPVRNPSPSGSTTAPISKPSASFLLPARDYTIDASQWFGRAAELADRYLTGSHPLRVSVKTEYAAYLYDCLHDGSASRRLAAQSLRDVYSDDQSMDDESFQETARLVIILDKMKRRGAGSGTSSAKGSTGTLGTPAPPEEPDIPPVPTSNPGSRKRP